MISDDATLLEAKNWLRERVDDGERCPCCTQFAKVYKRQIHATMARDLIRFYRAAGVGEWLHLPSLTGWGGDFGKLRYWGLTEEEIERRPDGGRAGFWLVTGIGESWVKGQIRISKYAHIYDGRCLRLSGEGVTIYDALGSKFNYDELMHGE